VYFVSCSPDDYTLTWSHISPHKLAGRFENKLTAQALIFESTHHGLHMINHEGKDILTYSSTELDPTNDFHYTLMGNYYPPNVTALSMNDVKAYVSSEARFLPDLYHAMAALGISGPEIPSAMGVYRMALGYEKYRAKFLAPAADCACNCPNAIGDYPQCLVTGKSPAQCCDCLGMCGSCGSCWNNICGDCCWYKGCCGHDICCYSPNSRECLLPIGLACGQVYTCSGYSTGCCNEAPGRRANHCKVEQWGCDCPKTCCTDWSCEN